MVKEPVNLRRPFAIGWHIVSGNRELRYNDGRIDAVGAKLKAKGMTHKGPELCHVGMHASPTVLDAMQYMPGRGSYSSRRNNVLRCVLVEGDVTNYQLYGHFNGDEYEAHDDKFVGRYRTALFEIKLSSFNERARKIAKSKKIDVESAYSVLEQELLKERLFLGGIKSK